MKTLIISIFFLSSTFVFGQNINDCLDQSVQFGQHGQGKNVSTACNHAIKTRANRNAFDTSQNRLMNAYGFGKMFYVERLELDSEGTPINITNSLTAGSQTLLSEIIAIEFNENDERVFVLNRNQNQYSVFSYSYNFMGNVAPIRKLMTEEIRGASNIKTDSIRGELIVLSQIDRWIKIFNLNADPDGQTSEHAQDVLAKFDSKNSDLIAPIDIAITFSRYYILDNDRVIIFNKNNRGKSPPVAVINNLLLKGCDRIEYESANNRVVLYKNDKIQTHIPVTE